MGYTSGAADIAVRERVVHSNHSKLEHDASVTSEASENHRSSSAKATKASQTQGNAQWGKFGMPLHFALRRRDFYSVVATLLWIAFASYERDTRPSEPYLQGLWSFLTDLFGDACKHWLFANWIAMGTFFVVCMGFTYKDLTHDESTKLQRDYWPTGKEIIAVAVPQIVIYLAAGLGSWIAFPDQIGVPMLAPSLFRFVLEVAICFLVGDFFIYWSHRIMHMVPYLRKNIHSVHHLYHAPFSWAGGWVHPVEDLVVVGCQLVAPAVLKVHPLSLWVFSSVWVAFLVEEHSGHDVWWAPWRWMPFADCPFGGGGAPHDVHHYRVNNNFGFVLVVWDRLFGTYVDPCENDKGEYIPDRPKFYTTWWEFRPERHHDCWICAWAPESGHGSVSAPKQKNK